MKQTMERAEFSITQATLDKWQEIVDLLARVADVRAALVMRLSGEDIEVVAASRPGNNPYAAGYAEPLFGSGLYCERVITSRAPLFVADAGQSPEWRGNPDHVKHNLVSYLGFPICFSDGKPFGTLCMLDDRAREKSAEISSLMERLSELMEKHLHAKESLWSEQQAARHHKSMGHLARGLAHDFSNAIGNLIGNIEVIKGSRAAAVFGDEERAAIEDMELAVGRAQALVEGLHSIAWDADIKLSPLSLASLCKELSRIVPLSMPSTITVRLDHYDDLLFLGNKTMLMAAILNIAINARDAMPDGGTLGVCAGKGTWTGNPPLIAGDWTAGKPGVEIRISDTGTGIPPEEIPKLLRPMFTTKKEAGGHGLGLYMVGQFVNRCRAALWVESAPGRGTTFHILMPLA